MDERVIGIDIGATKIHIGVVHNSQVVKEQRFATLADSSKERIIQNIINGIEELNVSEFTGIGIGVPGLVDEKEGVIYDLLNIPSWKEVRLKEQLEDHFRRPVRITNDANVFAVGEKMFGQGAPFKNLVGLTLGTGLGAGIIADGKLYSGTLSSAGELGIIPYLDKTIEDYCSGKFFRTKYDLDGDQVYYLAKNGNARALDIMKEYGNHLGYALKIVLNILSPQAIFLGGSISNSFHFFEASLRESLDSFPFKRVRDQLMIAPSTMTNVSILGAAALVLSENFQQGQLLSDFKLIS